MNTWKKFWMAPLFFLPSLVCGWNSIGPLTHERITDDAINLINSTTPMEFPDAERFSEELRDGSETEAHAPPNESGSSVGNPHRWWPEAEHWWGYTLNADKKCVLQEYTSYNFSAAYLKLGYLLHLLQDTKCPPHEYRCIHGTFWHLTDDLEDWVDSSTNYGYSALPAGRTFIDSNGDQWYYWLHDTEDDDDCDDVPDGTGGGGTIADADGDFNVAWGLAAWEFGTYGHGNIISDRIPGLNKGDDYFQQYPNPAVAHYHLYLACAATRDKLDSKLKLLPPLIPDDTTNGQPLLSKPICGPLDPVEISFTAMENRKPTVYISILAGTDAIKDTNGIILDGSTIASYLLSACSDTNKLPWESIIATTWNGDINSGVIEDGTYEMNMSIKDYDGNSSSVRTRILKFDGTKPLGLDSVTKIPD